MVLVVGSSAIECNPTSFLLFSEPQASPLSLLPLKGNDQKPTISLRIKGSGKQREGRKLLEAATNFVSYTFGWRFIHFVEFLHPTKRIQNERTI
jgi:hypothetical protein